MADTEYSRFPLQWPAGWPRTVNRQEAKFRKGSPGYREENGLRSWKAAEKLTIGDATKRLAAELRRLGVREGDWLVSSNIPVRLDGLPFANAAQPKDPGIAVYFRLGAKREPRVLACDRWRRAADNIAAIAGHIEALRAQTRYGVGSLDQAFAGYAAIPARTGGHDWHAELGFGPLPKAEITRDVVEARFRELARARHPDQGGSHEAMARLNQARAAALEEIGR